MIKNIFAIFYILLLIAIYGDAGIFDGPPHQCGLSDHECHRKFFQIFGSYYSKIGIPELGVPILDPMQLHNVTVVIPNIMNMTLVDGQASGVADCLALKYDTYIENKTKISEVLCSNITIWGTYELSLVPSILNSLGEVVHGSGKIRVELERWHLDLHYPFAVEKHENGDIFIRCLFDKVTYKQDLGGVHLDIENIKLGDEDISQTLVDVVNRDWKFFEPTFGKYFTDRAIKFYAMTHNLFFDAVPAKYYIKEDLSPYL